MTKYIEIIVESNPLYNEFIGDILQQEGCKGIVLSEEFFSGPLSGQVNNTVKAFLPDSQKSYNIIDNIKNRLKLEKEFFTSNSTENQPTGSWEVTYNISNDEDWAESWKQYWHPMKIGQKIVICPSWEEYTDKKDTDIIIKLDPGGAFGTGTHATTRLCIQALEKILDNDHKINTAIDVGTGSGILAIAAAKLGVKNIYGIDIESVSIDVSIENAENNNVSDVCHFDDNSIRKTSDEYDLVIVNILAKTIHSMAEDIKRITKRNGILLLSGLITKTVQPTTEIFESLGFSIQEILQEEEWHAIIAKRD